MKCRKQKVIYKDASRKMNEMLQRNLIYMLRDENPNIVKGLASKCIKVKKIVLRKKTYIYLSI